jgi:hypothetical protein
MSTISVNFNEVPDKILPLREGERMLEVQAPDEKKGFIQLTKDGTKTMAVITLAVVDDVDPNEKGRQVTDYIVTGNQFGLVRLKQLALSAGVRPGAEGLDLTQLIGKRVKAMITTRTYKDDSGVEQQSSSVKSYIPDPLTA